MFCDIFDQCVRPYALTSQQAVEPWVTRRAEGLTLQRIDEVAQSIHDAKHFLSVLALLRQHLSPAEIARFVLAWSARPTARRLCAFWRHMPSLLGKVPADLRGCALQSQELPLPESSLCLGPHCQCPGASAHKAKMKGSPNQLPQVRIAGKAGRKQRGYSIRVPTWVAYAGDLSDTAGPRYQVHAAGGPTGVKGMFRPHLSAKSGSRCQVPIGVYQQHADVDTSLSSGLSFLDALKQNMQLMLGDVGVNAHMQRLLGSCAIAWDWDYLLSNPPVIRHIEAFLHLVKACKGTLAKTLWPDPKPDQIAFPSTVANVIVASFGETPVRIALSLILDSCQDFVARP